MLDHNPINYFFLDAIIPPWFQFTLTISRRPSSSPNFHRRHIYYTTIKSLQIPKVLLENRTLLEQRRELDVIIRHAKVEETQSGVSLLVWRWLNDAEVSIQKFRRFINRGREEGREKKVIPMDCSTIKPSG